MILGYGCMENAPTGELTQTHVNAAIARMAKFLFVGEITQWHLSICLFNKLLTGEARVSQWQIMESAPGRRIDPNRQQKASLSHYDEFEAELPRDWADGAVYEYASERFRADLHAHGLLDALNSSEALLRLCPVDQT